MGCGYFQDKTNLTKLTIDVQGIILYYPLNERHTDEHRNTSRNKKDRTSIDGKN